MSSALFINFIPVQAFSCHIFVYCIISVYSRKVTGPSVAVKLYVFLSKNKLHFMLLGDTSNSGFKLSIFVN